MTQAVARDLTNGLFAGGLVALLAEDDTISFVDYKFAHRNNNTNLERYFRYDKTYTLSIGGSWTENYYEIWTPI